MRFEAHAFDRYILLREFFIHMPLEDLSERNRLDLDHDGMRLNNLDDVEVVLVL